MHRATLTFGLYYDSDQDLLFSGLSLEAGPSLLTGHWEQSTVSRTGSLRPFFWIYFNQPVCAILRFDLICPKISGETSFMAVICPKKPDHMSKEFGQINILAD